MNAIILAGGLGTRLRSVVHEVPKCMAPVAGRPFLSYLLDYLAECRCVERVVLSVGYLREAIFAWVDRVRAAYPFEIAFSVETEPLGTGGGIRLALGQCTTDDVMVLNGDTMFEVGIGQVAACHAEHPDVAVTLALREMHDFDRYGTVGLTAEGRIRAFREKRPCAVGLINGGVYIVRRSRLNLDVLPVRFSFERDVLEPHAGQGDLLGCICDAYFIDIGIPADYCRAQYDFLVRSHRYRTLLLDRDGTINVRRPGDYVKRWEEFQFLPAFLAAAPALGRAFERVFVVTNQRGVGRGLMTEAMLSDVHRRMCAELQGAGLHVDEIFACFATDDDAPCRKPNTGMWEQLRARYPEVDPASTVMVGDGDCDRDFAARCGIDFVRV